MSLPPGTRTPSPDYGSFADSCRRVLLQIAPRVAAVSVLVAVSLRRYLPSASADALVPALISTQRLTFFYWGQDRLASIVPALAWPIRDPIWNFRFQMIVNATAFFALIMMFVTNHVRATRRVVSPVSTSLATIIAGLLTLSLMRPAAAYSFVLEQPYALSLALMLWGGWLVLRRPVRSSPASAVAGSLLVLAALLLNPSVVLLSPALSVAVDHPSRRRLIEAAAVVVAAFVASQLTSRMLADASLRNPYYNDFSFSRVGRGVDDAVSGILGSAHLGLAGLVGAACLATLALRWRAFPTRLRVAYVGAPLFGLVWLVVFSGNEWVAINVYVFRYFFPIYAAGMLAIAGVTAEWLHWLSSAATGRLSMAPVGRFGTGLAAALAVLGTALVVAVARDTRVRVLATTADSVETARQLDISLVLGDYWTTWPIVVAGRSDGLDLLGVTERSEPLSEDIRAAVARSLTTRGFVRGLCPAGDVGQCVAELGDATDEEWTVHSVEGEAPFVLDLIPTTS